MRRACGGLRDARQAIASASKLLRFCPVCMLRDTGKGTENLSYWQDCNYN
jgi:hypothetical protein